MHSACAKPICCLDRQLLGPNVGSDQPLTGVCPRAQLLGGFKGNALLASQVRAGLRICRQLPARRLSGKRVVVVSMAASDATDSKPKVAFLGIGIMGLGMVRSGAARRGCNILHAFGLAQTTSQLVLML